MANTPNQELNKASGKIYSFFSDFKTISREKQGYNVSRIKMDLMEKYFDISSEQNAPNEFNALGYQNDYKRDISVTRYVNFFNDMFLDARFNNCTFDFDVLTNQSILVRGPEYKKNEAPASFAQVVVRKTYKRGYTVMRVFSDTLQLNMETMTICRWANDVSTHHIGGNNNEVVETIEQMRLNAALAYDRKEYYKAYKIYETIVQKYPKEGDPYYRMAVMLYKKDVYSSMGRRERLNKVLNYLDLAVSNGGYSTRKCADNMIYWITGGQNRKSS